MQISEITVIKGLWAAIVLIVGVIGTVLGRIIWKVCTGYSNRLNAVEAKVAEAVTLTEVQVIVADVKREFKGDHNGLAGRLDRVETGLRQEIRDTHDSLQDSIDKVVNILLTRDDNDRRRRGG